MPDVREEYPAIAARAQAENVLAWADQCGLRPDTTPPGRSWVPKGRTRLSGSWAAGSR
ncbi:hypothetical protein [Streptomyces aureoversilis]|uniref:Uncharacterized protein n=1 Tax=Streptomyces aureoversilis TaxID=67277 RepID=A0ABW0ABQ4_9ACTN